MCVFTNLCFAQGDIPVKGTSKSVARQRTEREYYHWAIRQVMEVLGSYERGIKLVLYDGQLRYLLPLYCMSITDWPEGQKLTNLKEGASNSPFNCRVCLTSTFEFSNTEAGLVAPRRTELRMETLRRVTRERVPGSRYPGNTLIHYIHKSILGQ